MNSKKRLMFILEEDYYYLTLKTIAILKALKCDKKCLVDYRKICLIYEVIKDPSNIDLINKSNLDIFESNKLLNIAYSAKMNSAIFKRIIFFLEKKNIIRLEKNIKQESIDVYLCDSEEVKFLISENLLKEDIIKVEKLQKEISRIRSVKFSTLNNNIFGKSDVVLWEG